MNRRNFVLAGAGSVAGLALGVRPAAAGHSVNNNLPYGGVNTHITYYNTPYGDASQVAEAVKQLGARWARDGVPPGDLNDAWHTRAYAAFRRVHDDGSGRPLTKFSSVGGHPAQSVDATLDALAPLVNEGIVRVIEGANEWDLNYKDYGYAADEWLPALRAHQEELYRKVKARWPGLSVAGPTLASLNAEAMGDLSYAMDLGNLHHYVTKYPMSSDDLSYLDRVMARNAKMWGTKPVIATEAGMYIGDGQPNPADSTGENVQDDGFQLLAAELGKRGVHRVFAYELVNGSRPSVATTHAQNNFGTCRVVDGVFRAKPLFYPVRDACRRG